MNCYFKTAPNVIQTQYGTMFDIGVRKIFPSNAGLRLYNEFKEKNPVVGISCFYDEGRSVIFFVQDTPPIIETEAETYKLGYAKFYNDTLKELATVKGVVFKVRFGSMQEWSDNLFVPVQWEDGVSEVQLLHDFIAAAIKVKELCKDAPSLHRSKIEKTIGRLMWYEELGLSEEVYWATVAHMLLYRPEEELYKNFQQSLENCFKTDAVTTTEEPSAVQESLDLSGDVEALGNA